MTAALLLGVFAVAWLSGWFARKNREELPPLTLPDVPVGVVDATEPLFQSVIRADVPFVVVWRDTRMVVHHWPVCMSATFEAALLIDCAAEASKAAL